MSKFFKTSQLLAAGAVMAVAAVATPALAEPTKPLFTVQESAIAGAAANMVTADRIGFGYNALITQQANGSFTETGAIAHTAFLQGTDTQASQLNSFGANGYKLYGLFTITGTSAPNGAGGVTATFNTLTLNLIADADSNTTFSRTGVRGGTISDDTLLATYTFQFGEAHVFGGLAKGDFNAVLTINLTAAGQAYFISPLPFYLNTDFNGNTADFFDPVTGATTNISTGAFTAGAEGSGNLFFLVPEPTSLALLGAGLAGLGFVRRRKAA